MTQKTEPGFAWVVDTDGNRVRKTSTTTVTKENGSFYTSLDRELTVKAGETLHIRFTFGN